MQKNYERMAEETALAYEAFSTYRDMGAGRSHAKVAEILEKPVSYIRQLKQWSKQYNWVGRCLTYDKEQENIRRLLNEQKKKDDYVIKLQKYREDNENIGNNLVETGSKILQIVQERISALDLDDVRVSDIASLARVAAQCADIGGQLLGQALGVEQLLERMNNSEI